MKMKKNKLKKLLEGLSDSNSDVREVFKTSERYLLKTEKEMQEIAGKLQGNAEVRTVEMAKKKIAELKEQVQSIFNSVVTLKDELKQGGNDLTSALNQKIDALKSAMVEYRTANLGRLGTLSEEMDELRDDIREISQRKVEIPNYENQIGEIENTLGELVITLKEETEEKINKVEDILTESKKTAGNLEEEIKKLRRDTMSAIASKGGGNMNRNILVGNNPSTLGRYTDLNILAGNNITLTYTNNDNLKTTNLTIAATGGAGSGITRNVATTIVSSVIGAVAATDYVIVAGAGVQITLPTAVGNSNLYTIKNKSSSSVLVVADGAETIDDAATALMQTQYTAIDLISDNANWHVT